MTWAPDRSTTKLVGLATLLACLAASTLLALGPASPPLMAVNPTPWLFPSAVAVFLLGEVLLVRMRFRSEAHDFNLTDIPLTLGLFLMTPGLMALAALTAALGTRIARRQHPLKALVNLTLCLVETATAALVFHVVLNAFGHADLIISGSALHPVHWLAATLALVAANSISGVSVGLLISIVEGRSTLTTTLRGTPLTLAMTIANTTVTMACLAQFAVSFWSGVFMIGPVLVLFTAYHAYVGEREEAAAMKTVVTLTTAMATAPTGRASLDAVLGLIQHELGAGLVLLLLDNNGGADQTITSLIDVGRITVSRRTGPLALVQDSGATRTTSLDGVSSKDLRQAAAVFDGAAILSEPCDGVLGQALCRLGVTDALIATLRGDDGPLGLLVVANRQGEVTRWRPHDRELAATIAAQMSTLLRSSQLSTTLEQIAEEHAGLLAETCVDELTGMQNRRGLRELVEHQRSGGRARIHAAIYMDLDEFKQVNDSHGHAVGDELLRVVGRRLSHVLRSGDAGVRLGGDEFAILVREPISRAELQHMTGRLRDQVCQPVIIDGVKLTPTLSIGTAHAGEDDDLHAVLHTADIRMYEDKRARKAARAGALIRNRAADQQAPALGSSDGRR